jgi:hypothetical protein
MKHDCLGFLGISLAKYTSSKFLQLENLQVGILKIEGYNDKISEFLNSSSNKILKCNDEIIFFKDKKKYQIETIQDESDCSASDSDSSFIGENYNFSNPKFEILTNFLKEFEKELYKIRMNNIKQFGITKSKLKSKIFDNIPEYYLLEKKKVLCLYKIYGSFSDYNIDNSDLSLSANSSSLNQKIKHKVRLDFDILKSDDPFLQKIIMETILLRILCILNNDLAYQILKYILKIKEESSEGANLCVSLKLILEIEVIYLLGLYFDLNLHLNEISRYKNQPICKELEMNELYFNVNKLSKKYLENFKIFSKHQVELSSLISRKNFINLNLINFYSKDLNNINEIISITQHLYDFIISRKIETDLSKVSFYSYRIFLEIRNYFFEYINKSDNLEHRGMIFNSLSDKEYFNYKLKKLDYDCHFKDTNKKQYNLTYKDKGGKYDYREEKIENKKINLPVFKEKKSKIAMHRHYNSSLTVRGPLSLDSYHTGEIENSKFFVKNTSELLQINKNTISPESNPLRLLKQLQPKTNDTSYHLRFKIQSNLTKSDTLENFRLKLKNSTKKIIPQKLLTSPNSPIINRRKKFKKDDTLLPSLFESKISNSILTNNEEEVDRISIHPLQSKWNSNTSSSQSLIIKKNNILKNLKLKTVEKENNNLVTDTISSILPLRGYEEVDEMNNINSFI